MIELLIGAVFVPVLIVKFTRTIWSFLVGMI